MKKQVGPVRIASWGHAWLRGVRGAALTWNGRRVLLSFEVHYERRRG